MCAGTNVRSARTALSNRLIASRHLLLLPLAQQRQSLAIEPVGLGRFARLDRGPAPRPPVGMPAAGQDGRADRCAGGGQALPGGGPAAAVRAAPSAPLGPAYGVSAAATSRGVW